MSRIVRGIFGGSSSSERILQRYQPVGFQTSGATGAFNPGTNTYSVSQTPQRRAAIGQVVAGFNERAATLRGLRSQVTPGFGRLSQIRQEGMRTRLAALRGESQRAVGNVREQLARRRLQGSSFQASEVARTEAQFGREMDIARAEANQAEAEAFLQEIAASSQLVAQEFDAAIAGAQTTLNELNFDTQTASQMAGQASALMAANLTAQAEARAAQQSAGEDFLGTIMGLFNFGKK